LNNLIVASGGGVRLAAAPAGRRRHQARLVVSCVWRTAFIIRQLLRWAAVFSRRTWYYTGVFSIHGTSGYRQKLAGAAARHRAQASRTASW
jgi:hypothetical protein